MSFHVTGGSTRDRADTFGALRLHYNHSNPRGSFDFHYHSNALRKSG